MLSLVEAGETIEITRHGVVIARISQATQPVPDMDNRFLWKLSEARDANKNITKQLRKVARF